MGDELADIVAFSNAKHGSNLDILLTNLNSRTQRDKEPRYIVRHGAKNAILESSVDIIAERYGRVRTNAQIPSAKQLPFQPSSDTVASDFLVKYARDNAPIREGEEAEDTALIFAAA